MLAFFDESMSVDAGVYGVAGYVFTASAYEGLDSSWQATLAKYGVGSFHMVDCAHGAKEFAKLTREQRIALQTELFEHLTSNATLALEMTFELACAHKLRGHGLYGLEHLSGHSLCAWWAVRAVATWIRREMPNEAVLYQFEAGANDEAELRKILEVVFTVDTLSDRFRYAGHAFLQKAQASGVQCADALAWQSTKNFKRKQQGFPPRKDYVALQIVPTIRYHFGRTETHRLAKIIRKANRFVLSRRSALIWWRATYIDHEHWQLFDSKLAATPPAPAIAVL